MRPVLRRAVSAVAAKLYTASARRGVDAPGGAASPTRRTTAMLRAVALDRGTEKIYHAADTGTLLALLPLLRTQIERARAEMEHAARYEEASADADAEIAEGYGELLAVLDARMGDDPRKRDFLQGIRDRVSAMMASLHENDSADAEHVAGLLRYSVELTEREHWIIDEMRRRGYLPPYLGEEHSL